MRSHEVEQRCRYVAGFGYYLPSHEHDCTDRTCDGCQPCAETHCTAREACTRHLDHAHPLTCPRCEGRTRDDIAEIVRLSGLLIDEAIAQGVDSEAANLAGPAADPEAWSWRRLAAWERGDDVTVLEDDDPHHPLAVLGRWDYMLREDYRQPTALRCTLLRAADYLRGQLSRLAQDETQDFALFAREIARCRRHLEDVLADGFRPETGAPCPACAKAPALVKRYAHWCWREDCTREHDATGAADSWVCPACHARWTEAEYRLWVADDYLDNADALTAADMAMVHGIKPATLRKWAERGQVARRGRNTRGQQLYDVEQAVATRRAQAACLPDRGLSR
jgi:hypothetical protein